jgi:hypothetical protein
MYNSNTCDIGTEYQNCELFTPFPISKTAVIQFADVVIIAAIVDIMLILMIVFVFITVTATCLQNALLETLCILGVFFFLLLQELLHFIPSR